MGVTTNVSGFVAKTRKLSAAIPVANRLAVTAAADATKASILASARARRWKPRSSWVSVSQRGSPQNPGALVELRGAHAYWAERGTKAHDIGPRRKKAVLTPQGPRAGAHVAGAKARPFWRAGTLAARPAAERAYGKIMAEAIRKAF